VVPQYTGAAPFIPPSMGNWADELGPESYCAAPMPPMQLMARVESRAVEGAISTNFVIRGLNTVPSDLDTYPRTEHKVTVAELELDPKLEWIAVPKIQPSAFFRVSRP